MMSFSSFPNLPVVNCVLAFSIAMACTGVLIPEILLISFRKRLFDFQDERKIHKGAVPRLGGIAFFPVILFSVALLAGIRLTYIEDPDLTIINYYAHLSLFGMCGGLMLYLVGMADDLVGVRYSAKFVVQILAGCLMASSGLWINSFDGFLGIYTLPAWLGVPLTVLLFVFVTNAINLIDGLDGLASGLTAVALLFYGFFFLLLDICHFAIIAFAALGTVVSFFYFNVFGDASKHKKIFMGDTGSLTLGFVLCFLSLSFFVIDGKMTSLPANAVLAFSPLIVPCFDAVRVFARRIRHHRNPFLPDRTHIHHKLLAHGLPKGLAMVAILSVSAFFIGINLLMSRFINITWVLLIDIAVWTIANYLINARLKALGIVLD